MLIGDGSPFSAAVAKTPKHTTVTVAIPIARTVERDGVSLFLSSCSRFLEPNPRWLCLTSVAWQALRNSASEMTKGCPQILIVDDEEGVREAASAILADEGFPVTAVATASEALTLLASGKFSLVIMDVRLAGGQNGLEVVRQARLAQPGLKSLYISGGASALRFDPILDGFVRKPFYRIELIGCLWELYSRSASGRKPPAYTYN